MSLLRTFFQRGISVKVVPHSHGQMRDLHLPYWLITLGGLAAVGVITGLVILGVNYAQKVVDENRLKELRERTVTQGSQLDYFDEQIDDLRRSLAQLEQQKQTLSGLHPTLSLEYPDVLETRAAEFNTSLPLEAIRSGAEAGKTAIKRLVERAKDLSSTLGDLEERLDRDAARQRFTPSVRPVDGEHCWITAGFGNRMSEFTGRNYFHRGIDITAPPGTPILAPADGTVTFADHEGNFGLKLIIDHGGYFVTVYAHLGRVYVHPGDAVYRGDVVATVGTTGRTLGPKLHYEVLKGGRNLDPARFFLPENDRVAVDGGG
jgi:murein DD-endopeptidase MepM/ murein hydrolase activator NlpD